jgi:hypothetical protein
MIIYIFGMGTISVRVQINRHREWNVSYEQKFGSERSCVVTVPLDVLGLLRYLGGRNSAQQERPSVAYDTWGLVLLQFLANLPSSHHSIVSYPILVKRLRRPLKVRFKKSPKHLSFPFLLSCCLVGSSCVGAKHRLIWQYGFLILFYWSEILQCLWWLKMHMLG